MKLLLTMNLPYTRSHGGTNRSNRFLAENLAAKGHSICIVVPALATPSSIDYEQFLRDLVEQRIDFHTTEIATVFTLNSVEVHAVKNPSQLRNYLINQIKIFQPDWTLVSSEDPSQNLLSAALKSCEKRVVYLAHTPQMFPFGPASLYPSYERTQLIGQAAAIVTISRFVSEYIEKWSGFKTFVNHPPHFGKAPFPNYGCFDNGYVLMMNPCSVKGFSIFLALAKLFGDINFAVLPGYGTTSKELDAIKCQPNMTVLQNRANIDDIFCKTRILVMPSLWIEGFGMAAVDAMLRGIPVLASNFGGLVEAKMGVDYLLPVHPIEEFQDELDEKLLRIPILPQQDVTPWQAALTSLLTERVLYEKNSQESYHKAFSFVSSLNIDCFEEFLVHLSDKNKENIYQSRYEEKALVSTSVESEKSIDTANLTPEQRALLVKRLMLKKRAKQTQQNQQDLPIPTVSPRQNLPLSFAQQRLWFIDQLENNSSAYNMPAAVQMNGFLNVSVFEQAILAIVERHEILRTTFPTIDGVPVQVIAPTSVVSLSKQDLKSLPKPQQKNVVQQLVTEEAQRPFDLATGPLLRLTLLELEEKSHVLSVNMHHIICDGWSIGLFIQELSTLYQALLSGAPPKLPELPIQYGDFSVWQRQWLSGEVLETQLNYWKQQLAGAPARLELPTDHPRPAVQTYRGGSETLTINARLTQQLQHLSQQSGTTLFMTLLAAFVILLSRYSHQDDIVVGSAIANRNRREIESLIGFFVNTLAIRIQLQENPTFEELLMQVRQKTLEAYAHQDLPFETSVEALHLERSLSYHPLFQVMFVLQNAPTRELELPGLTMTLLELESTTAKFDLVVSVEERETELVINFNYNKDLFEVTTVRRMIGHFQTLLETVVNTRGLSVGELPLLTATERRQLLVEWNQTDKVYPQDKCIHQLVETQVEKTPESVAVVFEDRQLTYRQLNEKANQLSARLQGLGITGGMYVPLLIPKSLDLLIAELAVMKTGAAFVPMDTNWPAARVHEILTILDAKVVLVCKTEPYPDIPSQWQCLTVDETELEGLVANLRCPVEIDDPIYVIFTSGSTGSPKGAINKHRGIVNRFFNMNDRYGCQELDVILFTSAHIFDASVWQLFWPLINGARTVIPKAGFGIDLEEIIELVEQKKVTVTDFVPSVFNLLVDYLAEHPEERQRLQTLRQLLIGGEAMRAKSIYAFKADFPNVGITNTYGPTETSIGTIFQEVPPTYTEPIPIGKPLHNVRALILDKYRNPVPVGVPGELYLGGECVGLGYLNNKLATQAAFIPNPWTEVKSAMLYKTGDMARYQPDGTIEFLGRLDNQVKIRGIRIELGEIESVLVKHPQVKETAVLVQEDPPGPKQLVAYVVPHQENELSSKVLRRFLAEKLPDYAVPSVFVLLEALPLTPNGKVDRRSLPSPVGLREQLQTPFVAPQTPTETTLAAIWADLLRLDKVSVHDNFFELGGDSILSIQVVARAKAAGLQLTPKQIFQHQTIAVLAGAVGTVTTFAEPSAIVTGAVPLTPIQHRFWEQNLLSPHHFNQAVLLEVPPDTQLEYLQQAVQQMLIHHDMLRTRFTPTDTGWQQLIAPPERDSIPFTVVDISETPLEQQQAVLEATASQLQTSLDIFAGSLVRIALFQMGLHQPDRLLLIIHHLVVDGVSWRILLEDITTVYQQLNRNQPIQLPAKTTSFKSWANQLTSYAQSDALAAEVNYWLTTPSTPVGKLPVDYPENKQLNIREARLSLCLSQAQTQYLLKEVSTAYNTQINDVLLTALVQTFAQWTNNRSLLIDLEGHGREALFDYIDISRTVGWFTTLFPVLLDLEDADNPGTALKLIKEQLRRIPNRGIGYGLLRYLSPNVTVQSQLQAQLKAEVSFNYLGQFNQLESASSWFREAKESYGLTSSSQRRRNYLLEINGFVVSSQLHLEWIYDDQLYRQSTIEGLLTRYQVALENLIIHCRSKEATEYTPSDFSAAKLNQKQLDEFLFKLTQKERR
ncbi:hypothetical protein NUACC21_63000 [Scytonema sp. NUACC21]